MKTTRKGFLRGSAAFACLSSASLQTALAGGTKTLAIGASRAGCEFVSIYMLDELRGVSIDDEENIRIGSLTSFSHITKEEC